MRKDATRILAEAHNDAGIALREAGQYQQSLDRFNEAIRLKNDYAEALTNRGIVLSILGREQDALNSHELAIFYNPQLAEAHNNKGVCQKKIGLVNAAIQSFKESIKNNPRLPSPHLNLAATLREQGNPEKSIEVLSQAKIYSLDSDAFSLEKACCQLALREFEAAVKTLLTIRNPNDNTEVFNRAMGIALQKLGCHSSAIPHLRACVDANPQSADAHLELGKSLRALGQTADARQSYMNAATLRPDAAKYALSPLMLMKKIADSEKQIDNDRTQYLADLKVLENFRGALEQPEIIFGSLTFDLSYHDRPNVEISRRLCQIFRNKSSRLNFSKHQFSVRRSNKEKMKIGVCSKFLYFHTIGKLNFGFIKHLDRSQFEVCIFHFRSTPNDQLRKQIDAIADKSFTLPETLAEQQRLIASLNLDILYYPDIGMAADTYFLAYARLAPVQVVGWGHPDTTGIDTIDYFLSATSLEDDQSESHYSERLIRLNRLPCFYHALIPAGRLRARSDLGLPDGETLYGCPQSLFKIHPEFDELLEGILQSDSSGRIVMLEGAEPHWTHALRRRWGSYNSLLNRRTIFLPRQTHLGFMSLLAQVDILLDPMHFGSGNSFYEGMVYGKPTVTLPGRFMRSRIVSAGYRQMNATEFGLIAETPLDYVKQAVNLATDTPRRLAVQQALVEHASQELFADYRAVREFEIFLIAAIDAAQRGEKLPIKWELPRAEKTPHNSLIEN